MNWRHGESNPKIQQHSAASAAFFHRYDHGAAPKIERKMSHPSIALDRKTPQQALQCITLWQ